MVLQSACRFLTDCAEPGSPWKVNDEVLRRRGTPTVFTRNNRDPMSATQFWNSKHPKTNPWNNYVIDRGPWIFVAVQGLITPPWSVGLDTTSPRLKCPEQSWADVSELADAQMRPASEHDNKWLIHCISLKENYFSLICICLGVKKKKKPSKSLLTSMSLNPGNTARLL